MREVLRDTAFCVGLALVTSGIWLIYPPASLIFGGACVSVIAYLTMPEDNAPSE